MNAGTSVLPVPFATYPGPIRPHTLIIGPSKMRVNQADKYGSTRTTKNTMRSTIDRLIGVLGLCVSWLVALLILNAVTVVILRYGFNISVTAMQESIGYLHATIFMLGICHAFQQNAHVSVDAVHDRLPPTVQTYIKLAGNLFLLLPFTVVLLWVSREYVGNSWMLREHSPETDGLPFVFLLKSLIPLMAITLLLAGLSDTLKQLKKLMH